MALSVQTESETSVGDKERIKAVTKRVAKTKAEWNEVVVVSAMVKPDGEMTNLTKAISTDPASSEMDVIAQATGKAK